jgi:hypothetical protein
MPILCCPGTDTPKVCHQISFGVKWNGANGLLKHEPEGPGFSQAAKAAPQERTALPKAGVEA